MPLSCSPACVCAAPDELVSACAWVVLPRLLPEACVAPVCSSALACRAAVSCDAGTLVA